MSHKTRSHTTEISRQPGLGFKQSQEQALRAEDLRRLKAADDLINVVLGEMYYIGKLTGLKTTAPVEDIEKKIKKSYAKINEYLARKEQALDQGLESGEPEKSGPPIEKHPLLPELGGMDLEWDNIDSDWMAELGVEQTQDKAEMQNQLRNKLKNKIENALKLAAKLQNKIKNKPGFQPAQKQVQELVTKYKLTLDELKNKPILKPEAPDLTPKYVPPPPKPSPFGMG